MQAPAIIAPHGVNEADFRTFLGQEADDKALRDKAAELLAESRRWWEAWEDYRTERQEARDFYYSRQWERYMKDEHGNSVREKDYLAGKGRVAVTMNLVATALNNVQGQFRQNQSEREAYAIEADDEAAVEMLNLARRSMRRQCASESMEADSFLEHALSGFTGFRSTFEFDPVRRKRMVKDYAMHPTRLFFNLDVTDRRFHDLRLVGYLHDVTKEELVRQFAESPQDAERIDNLYRRAPQAGAGTYGSYGRVFFDAVDFYTPQEAGLCRVIEVWCREYAWQRFALDPLAFEALVDPSLTAYVLIPDGYGPINVSDQEIQQVQAQRQQLGLPMLEVEDAEYVPVWHGYWMAPTGEVLKHQRTPYWHGEHPFTLSSALWIDGETRGIVANLRDPQRWLNRLLVNIDHQMTTGAKGLTLWNKEVLDASDVTSEQADEALVRGDQSLALNLGQNGWDRVAHQLKNQSLAAGYFEMIPTVMGFMERISGLTDAAQGLDAKSGTPAALYERQVLQAGINVFFYLDTYFEALNRKDRKEGRLVQQAIDEPRPFRDNTRGKEVVYDPERVRALEFDFAMGSAQNTATMRQAREDELRADVEGGLLPYELYLAHSSRPDAQKLLQDYQAYQQQQMMLAAAMADAGMMDEQEQ